MHILVHHVPGMLRRYGNLRQFSGQGKDSIVYLLELSLLIISFDLGVEKNNDTAKRNYYSSNHWDAPREILVTEARIETLANGSANVPSCKREKRPYNKQDMAYWSEGGIHAGNATSQETQPVMIDPLLFFFFSKQLFSKLPSIQKVSSDIQVLVSNE